MPMIVDTLVPQVHPPMATVVQVPSGFCTLVEDCLGCTPEGHTGLPDSKEGLSRSLNLSGLYTLTLVVATELMLGMSGGIEFLLHRQYLRAAFQAERQQELRNLGRGAGSNVSEC
jgi:hypothetical protein